MIKIFNFQFSIFNFIKHPLFSGSAIMIFGSNFVSFINYLFHLAMGRMLGPASYGELAALIALIGLLGMIPASMSLVIVKYVSSAKNEQEVNNLVSWLKSKVFQVSIVFCLIVLITSPIISSFLNITKNSYLFLIALSFLFSIQALLNRSILQGLLKFKEMVLSVLAENATKVFISVLLVFGGFQVGGAMLAFVISALLGWYITNFYLRYHSKKNPNLSPDVKSMMMFTVPVLIQSISVTSLYSSDVILVKHFFPSYDAGIYAALSMLGKIIFFGAGPIGAVMFPLVSQRKAKGQGYRKIFIYSFLVTALLAVSLSMIYWLFPHLAIKLLYGELYLGAAHLLVWFGIFISLFTLSSLLISYSLSLGRTSVVILPFIAAFAQIMLIWFFHQTLFEVILISIIVTALLLLSLLIYSGYLMRIKLWK